MTTRPHRRFRNFALLAAVTGLWGCAAESATRNATPATLPQLLRAAGPGDVITLAPGAYGVLGINRRSWATPVTLNAQSATFDRIQLAAVSGLTIVGGTVVADGGDRTKAVILRDSDHIALSDMKISHASVGVVIHSSDSVVLRRMSFFDLGSDGVHIAMSHHVTVDQSSCRNFRPTERTFDAGGKLVKDELHPDCIQGWSRPGIAPTSDITITNNVIEGNMQGISFFNHVRGGVDDGGFDRVTITGNRVTVTRPNGIALHQGRDSVIRDNIVSTLPGSKLARNGNPVTSRISILQGRSVMACGNQVAGGIRSDGVDRCRR